MSAEVDLSTPLTEDEYRYLTERSRRDLIDRAHEMHGTTDADYGRIATGDGTGPQVNAALQGESRAERRQRLLDELAAMDEGDEAEDESDGEDVDDRPYSEWTVQELDAQLKTRQLPTSGTKAEKVARLEADDAEA